MEEHRFNTDFVRDEMISSHAYAELLIFTNTHNLNKLQECCGIKTFEFVLW
jgi:hypothetical protein